MSDCKNEMCKEGCYPYYGVAPHSHDLSSGSFVGSTRLTAKSEWPKNFIEDKDQEGLGTYFCPDCLHGLNLKPESTKQPAKEE